MKKNIVSIVLLLITSITVAQKSQRLAYIDMQYILENIPAYLQAQNALDAKVEKWKTKITEQNNAIQVLKTDLANEKVILTKDLIVEREEDIVIKEEAIRRLETLYFGPRGDMYNLRKQLIKPIQDQVYNAIQAIASRKKYDFVFDKSGDLVMLYSNKKHDISDLVVKMINIDQKKQQKNDKIAQKKELLNKESLSDHQKEKLKKKELLKTKKQNDRLAKIKLIEEKRKAKLLERNQKRQLLKDKKEALRKKIEDAKKKE
ncbi:OmpH family outer membrane protein [Tenacibaculum piscium]|uniref:OmpH family outer membrane protein n=1 Tax=Tenacibaculum piscium TaxID=1458515 RepID=A0A2H1YJ43_9FLAO|nr:OmpH family outer membrane protein [Tenacibaculum piscium]MBE7628640.1 OmpH family outer membrane protein [Tenacibaculum piscium]MBE7669781.1 OmpH family outer membrane protein [Tenacibaculum piscium]MBE7684631.1 OmpH family outer membrane protein [Tenacibaculum piscium]MBE7689251.1 OmpH family outer membrane protein [Tenacibaculum piscium]MCG8182869.1 OmpH family outer membrane protein [Tenacibaculum piscium]